MKKLNSVSIIVPVAPDEKLWVKLLTDLGELLSDSSVNFVGPQKPPDFDIVTNHLPNVKWVYSRQGRGRQLNAGAKASSSDFFWFLHADSRLSPTAIRSLQSAVTLAPDNLIYFDLQFQNDGPLFMKINTLGAWIRSHILGLPFGDQGFCISNFNFQKIGGFDENASYGEDHLFVWRARHLGIRLHCTNENISTSSRKYKVNGWAKTTLNHAFLTWKQALPEVMRGLRKNESK